MQGARGRDRDGQVHHDVANRRMVAGGGAGDWREDHGDHGLADCQRTSLAASRREFDGGAGL